MSDGILSVLDPDGKQVPLTASLESFKDYFEPLGYKLMEDQAKTVEDSDGSQEGSG